MNVPGKLEVRSFRPIPVHELIGGTQNWDVPWLCSHNGRPYRGSGMVPFERALVTY